MYYNDDSIIRRVTDYPSDNGESVNRLIMNDVVVVVRWTLKVTTKN